MTNPRVLVLQFSPDDPPARLGAWLTDAGLDLEIRDVGGGAAVPADPDAWRALVVLGGPMSTVAAVGGEPYLAEVRALLRRAAERDLPALGVCLGAQLLALAHGGRVARDPAGPHLGARLVAKRQAAFRDPLFEAMPITPDVVSWHHDSITALPPGAQHLAASSECEYEAFRVGRLAWGLQFHIETTSEIVRGWAATDAAAPSGHELDDLMSAVDEAHEFMAEVWPPFVAGFADIVRDPAAVPEAWTAPRAGLGPVTDVTSIRAALAAEAHAARGGAAGMR